MTTGMMMAWIAAVVGFAGLVASSVLFMVPETAWRGMTRRGSRWANQASTAGCLLFVGLGLIGAGLLALSAGDAWRGWQSTRWVETEAVVQTARIVEVRQIRSTNPAYRIEPVYRYRFEGRDYTASLVAFGDAASPNQEAVEQEMAARFATGATLRAHVNPSNPTEAVLEPGVQMKAMILGGLGLAFVVIAVWQPGARERLGRRRAGGAGEARSEGAKGGASREAGEMSAMRLQAVAWRRLLAAGGIGLLATVAGCVAGSVLLSVIAAMTDGLHLLRAAPAFVFYGMIFGPVLAWPTTLVVLPGVWLLVPDEPRRRKRAGLIAAGALTGGGTLAWRIFSEMTPDRGMVGWAMIGAGVLGGVVAAMVFGVWVSRRETGRTFL